VLRFFSSCRNWDSPNPSPAGECAPPPGSGGRGTLAGERGVGRVPIPTRGHTLWYSLYTYTYFVVEKLHGKPSRAQKQSGILVMFMSKTSDVCAFRMVTVDARTALLPGNLFLGRVKNP
jgi:hypothetical protein